MCARACSEDEQRKEDGNCAVAAAHMTVIGGLVESFTSVSFTSLILVMLSLKSGNRLLHM
jgi:hypothetical protein